MYEHYRKRNRTNKYDRFNEYKKVDKNKEISKKLEEECKKIEEPIKNLEECCICFEDKILISLHNEEKHKVCKTCKIRLAECPFCREPLTIKVKMNPPSYLPRVTGVYMSTSADEVVNLLTQLDRNTYRPTTPRVRITLPSAFIDPSNSSFQFTVNN